MIRKLSDDRVRKSNLRGKKKERRKGSNARAINHAINDPYRDAIKRTGKWEHALRKNFFI